MGNLFRSRGKKYLGDFVNSPPVYVKGLVDLGYDSIGSGYRAFVTQKQSRSNAVVFLGGNAGVLHAFNGSTGAELYGYLPRAGLSNLHTISEKDYGTPSNYHRFFVDGPVIETDAFIATRRSPTAAWANLVVGSMGAGGTGFFALHVDTTNPTALDADTLLWERSGADSDDIGHIMGEIAVGKLKGGGWKAFVGNGVDSKNGGASLLIVDLATGSIDKTITVDSSSGNGLMGVTLLKNADKEVLGAYAGDLKGNLWRFDFGTSGSSADWKVGFNKKPLFTAKVGSTAQPITIAPTYLSHNSGPGRIVLFGTGKLLSTADASNTDTQSFYGVLDPTADGASSVTATSPFEAYSDDRVPLVPRVVTPDPVKTTNGRAYYSITGAVVDWATQKGWYLDFPEARQRDIYPSLILLEKYVLIQTMLPAKDADPCDVSKGSGFNYLLTARDGAPLTTPIFDTSGDGVIDEKDAVAAGYSTSADGIDRYIKPPKDECKVDCDDDPDPDPKPKCLPGYTPGLLDSSDPAGEWTCLPDSGLKIKDRIWRQIMNPPKAP